MLKAEIYLDMDEMKQDKPLHEYILEMLINEKIDGATVVKGFTGFGANQYVKKPDDLFSFDERPIVIIFIDEEEKVKQALKKIRQEINYGRVVTSQVDIWNIKND